MASVIISTVSLLLVEMLSNFKNRIVFLAGIIVFCFVLLVENSGVALFGKALAYNNEWSVFMMGLILVISDYFADVKKNTYSLFLIPFILYLDPIYLKVCLMISYSFVFHSESRSRAFTGFVYLSLSFFAFYLDKHMELVLVSFLVTLFLEYVYNLIRHIRNKTLNTEYVFYTLMQISVVKSLLEDYKNIFDSNYVLMFIIALFIISFCYRKRNKNINDFVMLILMFLLVILEIVNPLFIYPFFIISSVMFCNLREELTYKQKRITVPNKNNIFIFIYIVAVILFVRHLEHGLEYVIFSTCVLFYYLFSIVENLDRKNNFNKGDAVIVALFSLLLLGGLWLK